MSHTIHYRQALQSAILCLALLGALPSLAKAQNYLPPMQGGQWEALNFTHWSGTPQINSLAYNASKNRIYAAGNIRINNGQTSALAMVDTATGEPDYSLPRIYHTGSQTPYIHDIVSDGKGGFYICGIFDRVGDSVRHDMAHFDANGNLTAWAPQPDHFVDAMVYANGVVYFAGVFSNVNGQARYKLAAVDGVTGQLKSFNPSFPTGNERVFTMEVADSAVLIGGSFTQIASTNRLAFAALDTATGNLLNYDLDLKRQNNWSANVSEIHYISGSSPKLYVGGSFDTVGDSISRGFVEINPSTGLAAKTFDVNGSVRGFHVVGDTVYLGGDFGTVNGTTRQRKAVVRISDNTLLSLGDISTQNSTHWGPLRWGNTIFFPGDFNNVGPNSVQRPKIMAIDASTGNLKPFSPPISGSPTDLLPFNGKLLIGGTRQVGYQNNTTIAQINPEDGTSYATFPPISGSLNQVATEGDYLYFGGFSNIYVNYNQVGPLGRIDLRGDTLDSLWTPSVTNQWGSMGVIYSMEVKDGILYLGGQFDSINGVARKNLGAIDLATGNVTPLNVSFNGIINDIHVTQNHVWAGGGFSSANGNSNVRYAAKIHKSTGLLDTSFQVSLSNRVNAFHEYKDSIIMVGPFTGITQPTWTSRPGVAIFDTATGSLGPNILPVSSMSATLTSYMLGDTLMVGGTFTQMTGYPGTATFYAWDLAHDTLVDLKLDLEYSLFGTPQLNQIMVLNNRLHVVGKFDRVGGLARGHYAAFDLPLPPPSGATYVWNGSVSSTWNTPGNWTPSGPPAANDGALISATATNWPDLPGNITVDSLTIAPGASLNLGTHTLTVTNGLLVQSDATGTGEIHDASGGAITGTVHLQRHIGSNASHVYKYIASPLAGNSCNDLNLRLTGPVDSHQVAYYHPGNHAAINPLPNAWTYTPDRTADNWQARWLAWTDPDADLQRGTGYAMRFSNGMLTFRGTYVNGTDNPLSISSMTHTPLTLPAGFAARPQEAGFHLVGNPYIAPIDWNAVATANPNLDGTVYLYDGARKRYAAYNPISGAANLGRRYVDVGQAFFVRVTAGNTQNFQLRGQDRAQAPGSANVGRFFKTSQEAAPRFSLRLNGNADEIAAAFVEGATDTFDYRLDGVKLTDAPGPMLAFRGADNMPMCLQAVDRLKEDRTLPLIVSSGQLVAPVTLSAHLEDLPAHVPVYLEDRLAGTTTSLRANPTQVLQLTQPEEANRYFIHVGAPVDVVSTPATCAGGNGTLKLNTHQATGRTYRLLDGGNRQVAQGALQAGTNELKDLQAGTYTLVVADAWGETEQTVTVAAEAAIALAPSAQQVAPRTLSLAANATGASNLDWDLGDGNRILGGAPTQTHTYAQPGTYTVHITAHNARCATTEVLTVTVTNGQVLSTPDDANPAGLHAWVNQNMLTVEANRALDGPLTLRNALGQAVFRAHAQVVPSAPLRLDLPGLAAGAYTLHLGGHTHKLMVR